MKELSEMQKQYFEGLRLEEEEELAKNEETISSFKDFMAKKGITLTKENFRYFQTTGIVAIYPNIVNYLYPNLADKEGLFDFQKLCKDFEKRPFFNGYLFSEYFMLMANPYFRRNLHEINNFAPRLIELFWNLDVPNIKTYISLDMNRVRINVDDTCYFERDCWFGPTFNRDIESIKDETAKYGVPNYIDKSFKSLLFHDVHSIDIKWSTKNGIKSFYSEEFKSDEITIEMNNEKYHPVRYVHAEYDLDKKNFRHFDGAIQFYTETEYLCRQNSDLNYNRKNPWQIKTISQKLFKMDGQINIGYWIEFISHFYHGNPLIYEYIEGKYPEYIEQMLDK